MQSGTNISYYMRVISIFHLLVGGDRWSPCFGVVYVRRLHIGKGIKWKVVVQTIKGAKSAEKTSKIVLTNEDCGGNITKLSRETRVKTK